MPELSAENFGFIVLAIMMAGQWIYSARKSAREEDDRFELKNTPPIHKTYATRQEVLKLEQDFKESLGKVIARMDRDEVAAAGSRKRIYGQLSDLSKELASIGTKGDLTSQAVNQLSSKMDNLIAKVGNGK